MWTHAIQDKEEYSIKKVLSAAAMTYIASLILSILNLLRLVIMLSGRERDDRKVKGDLFKRY